MNRQIIDTLFIAGPRAHNEGCKLPTQDDYGMQYKSTAESTDSLIFLGVRLFKDDHGKAHSMLHDRAVGYPIQNDRYPESTTEANAAQLGGMVN